MPLWRCSARGSAIGITLRITFVPAKRVAVAAVRRIRSSIFFGSFSIILCLCRCHTILIPLFVRSGQFLLCGATSGERSENQH